MTATRYVTPLREGGSLPGLVEADDDGLYVLKFRGAGQGIKALVAEVIAGELARALGLAVPEIVVMEVDPALGAAEPDPEIQELITGSAGANIALDFLPGALPYTPAAGFQPTAELAAEVVWLDALVSNVDRTPAQPEPARLARPAVADRPRRGALLPPPRLGSRGRRGAPVRGHRRPRAAARGRHPILGRGRAARGALDARGIHAQRSVRCRPVGRRGAVRGVPDPPPRGAARVRGGGRAGAPRPKAGGHGEPFQYAIVRVVPRVERGECMNVGVVFFCRPRRYLAARIALDEARLAAFAPDLDAAEVRAHLDAMTRIAAGEPDSGPLARLEQSERFHWLVAPSSTVIQTSPVHTGLCEDPEETLARLLEKLVP